MKSKKELLKTNNLCKSYSNGKNKQDVILNMNVNIYEGDFTIIMGASGSGKSTLLHMLSGLGVPTDGKVIFQGEDITAQSSNQLARFRKNHCGYIFQQANLIQHMSIMDNVLLAGLLKNNNRKELVERANNLLDMVNIKGKMAAKLPSELSGGERQRVGIVRAIINKPDILFADEPTGALNSTNAQAVLNIFSEINNLGQSVIMVTHDINSALRGNRILFLKDGEIFDECNLGKYESQDTERIHKLKAFLEVMGW